MSSTMVGATSLLQGEYLLSQLDPEVLSIRHSPCCSPQISITSVFQSPLNSRFVPQGASNFDPTCAFGSGLYSVGLASMALEVGAWMDIGAAPFIVVVSTIPG